MSTDDMDIEEDLHTKIKKECRSQSPTSTSQPNTYENNENPNTITYDNENSFKTTNLRLCSQCKYIIFLCTAFCIA